MAYTLLSLIRWTCLSILMRIGQGVLTPIHPQSGYCAYLHGNLISWSSKRQHTVSRSSAEAEYQGVANAVVESCWLPQLLNELGHPP
jgi:hypothetical protein